MKKLQDKLNELKDDLKLLQSEESFAVNMLASKGLLSK